MDYKAIFDAINEMEKENRIDRDSILEIIKASIKAAYKKDYDTGCDIFINFNEEIGYFKVFRQRLVVESDEEMIEDEDFDNMISLEDALQIKSDIKLGEYLYEEIDPQQFSKVASQVAKGVVIQKLSDLRKARNKADMEEKEREIMRAKVRRIEGATVFLTMPNSQIEGVLMGKDQIPNESYQIGDEIKVMMIEFRDGNRNNPQVVVTRANTDFVRKLFEMEIPEIDAGLVEIKGIVRTPGYKTKIAVMATDPTIDPVGACVGNSGTRINSIIQDLNGERIDVIPYSSNIGEFVVAALSPAKVQHVSYNPDKKEAMVIIPDDKLSLAIGAKGHNVRLASKLTGYKIDLNKASDMLQDVMDEYAQLASKEEDIQKQVDELVSSDEIQFDDIKFD